jgi:hypothetical protein
MKQMDPQSGAGGGIPPSQHMDSAVVVTSAITALGGLLFGYDTGVVSGALLFLHNSFGAISSFQGTGHEPPARGGRPRCRLLTRLPLPPRHQRPGARPRASGTMAR